MTRISKRDEVFCQEVAKGERYIEAYLTSRPQANPGDDPQARKVTGNKASRLAAQPIIKRRIADILRASKVSDIASIGDTMAALNRNIAKAEETGDWKAVMAGLRLKAQMLGGLDQRLVISEEGLGDSALIERLAQGNPDLARQLRRLIPAEGFGSKPTVQ